MRSLRKIVFVNSANIRFAEVKLDGNVHFIGTQGVGKSTLLRAILFFYNADKLHLGIPKEMRSFDDFYLPHANSYIVYEVEHEHGPFSILVFRSSGRACYRFVDAAFRKEWLIDEHGEVTAESKVIRDRLGGVFMSGIIDRYETYRNIIYGNKQSALDGKFARFHLIETNQYQNIPRSIQNVFLNSRLDANFIKDIIIRSMSEEEANIDLGYFRRQVADFEQEYKDISCWYKLNQKGESTVRTQADNVVKVYHQLLFVKHQIDGLCCELKYAERAAREKLPLVDARIAELKQEQDRQKRLHAEVQKKYNDEKDNLNQKLGGVNDKLKDIKERRERYSKQDIEQVIARCQKEPGLKAQLEGLKEHLAELTLQFNDVTTKYNNLCRNVANQLDGFRQAQKERILLAQAEKQKNDERLLVEFSSAKNAVEATFANRIAVAEGKVEAIKTEQNDCEKELLKLNYFNPFKDEIEASTLQLNQLKLRQKELEGNVATLVAKTDGVKVEFEKQEAEINDDFNRNYAAAKAKAASFAEQINGINAVLSRISGSLYEWLQSNKPDWEQNIGRIINEESVLYRLELNPKIAEGDSLYGVEIDLNSLPQNVRKPKQLKKERAELQQQLDAVNAELTELQTSLNSQIDELKRRFTPKIKDLRQQKAQCETELDVIPQQRKAILVEIEDYNAKARQMEEDRRNKLTARQQELADGLAGAKSQLEKIIADKQKQLKAAEKRFNDAKEENRKNYTSHEAIINAETKAREQDAEAELSKLRRQELLELKGRGADTAFVEDCKAKIKETEDSLAYIDQHRELVIRYKKDKEELFDREDEFKGEKRILAEKLLQLNEKYAQRSANHLQQLSKIGKELEERSGEKKSIEDDLSRAAKFIGDSSLCPSAYAYAKEKLSLLTPGQAVEKLIEIIVKSHDMLKKLKESINLFKGNFSTKNTFNFRIELNADDDYFDFADNLNDFLINNKIDEYRTRTSERYIEILARVSKEMGELTRHESDVARIINAINNDFKERNFVGVIKLIALQSVPSADKMVQLMKRIKDFNDDNSLSLGELNIFSTVNRDDLNRKAVEYLLDFMKSLNDNSSRQELSLSDLFQLQFRIKENDNDTGWADKLSHVGSEGTDTLVKAMINIMLINVFKDRVSRKFGDFRIHCMMDEIGKLHPQNVKGILDFANARNILLINSSPTTYNVSDYRYTYLLQKDGKSKTVIHQLISQR